MLVKKIMNIFKQLLNGKKLNANEVAICSDNINNKYKRLDDYLKNITDLIEMQKPVVAYTNSNPVNITTTTLSLNTSVADYKFYEIVYEGYKGNRAYKSTGKIPIEKGALLEYAESTNFVVIRTTEAPSEKGLKVNTCSNNSSCIPYQVILYKN